MRILILGAGSFIGTNLALEYIRRNNIDDHLLLFEKSAEYFRNIKKYNYNNNVEYYEGEFNNDTDFNSLVSQIDVVYHLISTTIPATSNDKIYEDFHDNVLVTIRLLDACARKQVKKVVFISSGGTVYGKDFISPLKEDMETYPISSYGIQKLTIEKLLVLYNYLYGLDYRAIRLANPYGPFQRVNGDQGVITSFMYRVLKKMPVYVFGDGSIIRDYIYIDDAIKAILNIVNGNGVDQNGVEHKIFNVGSGKGTSIHQVIELIKNELNVDFDVIYQEKRMCDVPINYLDISLYESIYGKIEKINLQEGIRRLKKYLDEDNNMEKL